MSALAHLFATGVILILAGIALYAVSAALYATASFFNWIGREK